MTRIVVALGDTPAEQREKAALALSDKSGTLITA